MLQPTAVHAGRDKQINPSNCFCFPYSVHILGVFRKLSTAVFILLISLGAVWLPY